MKTKKTAGPAGDFTQENRHGCNGCDDIKAKLNNHGYCQECASEQSPVLKAIRNPKPTQASHTPMMR